MGFAATLNLIWALVGAGALVALGVSEWRRRVSTFRSRCRRGIAVFVATVALFPCISASDDLVCLAQLQPGGAPGSEFSRPLPSPPGKLPRIDLALRLEVIGNFRVSTAHSLLNSLCALATVAPAAERGCDRPLPARPGRAPPSFYLI